MSPHPAVSQQRILFVYDRVLSSFMARDWSILSRSWPNSEAFCWRGWHDAFRLGQKAAQCNAVFCWFGAAQALASVLVTAGRVPVVIVAGGWDVANLPEIRYGAHASFWRHHVSRFLFARARRVLAVSEFTRKEALRYAGVDPERLFTVYHGFDASAWALGHENRTLDVVTVSGSHAMVKGIDLVIDTAVRMTDLRFEVVGPRPGRELQPYLSDLPSNVTFTGPLTGEAYKAKLRSAKICFQPSRQESFGCAVAEAMLCGCIPVVSNRGALPEVLGEIGWKVDRMLPQEFERALRAALPATESDRLLVRQRIAEAFGIDTYAQRLITLVREVL
jgi:glycosyltransferase involved in cell wall biosynthesis